MKLRLFLVLFLLFGTQAFAADAQNANPNNNNHVYNEDTQNILITSDHPQFTIQLKSNPTTGFSWFLREHDANMIAPIKHTFQAPTDKMMGAPGTEVWTFRVKPAGFVVPQQTTIRLIYSRPWQSADSATQIVFRITTRK